MFLLQMVGGPFPHDDNGTRTIDPHHGDRRSALGKVFDLSAIREGCGERNQALFHKHQVDNPFAGKLDFVPTAVADYSIYVPYWEASFSDTKFHIDRRSLIGKPPNRHLPFDCID